MSWTKIRSMLVSAVVLAPVQLFAQGGTPQSDGYTYYWPGECVQAVQRSDAFYWRARQDTALYSPTADTMLAPSVEQARACIAKINSASVPPYALVQLAAVYLAVNDDASARAAITRRLADTAVRAPGSRAWVLADIVAMYLGASLPRIEAAKEYLRQLDALRGADAAVGKVRAYYSLAGYYWGLGDDSNMVAASETLIADGKELNDHDRIEFAGNIFFGYRIEAEAAGARTGNATASHAIMLRAKADLGQLPNVGQAITSYDSLFALYGRKGATLVANDWIGAAGDTIHPAAGKYGLIVFGPFRENVPAIRRIATAYGEQLDVTFVRGTYGYFKDLGPLTPQAEAADLQDYFTKDLKIPGSMALTYTQFNKIPDGRRVNEPSANDKAYRTNTGATVIVLDREGIVRRILINWDKSYESRIGETLQKYGARPQ